VARAVRPREAERSVGGRPQVGAAARSLSDADCAVLVGTACCKPAAVGVPVTHWSIRLLGDYLRGDDWDVSDSMVQRILCKARLKPHKQKMWLNSHDDEYRQKRDDVLGVYYDSPEREHVICVDEKTGMQALERRFADQPMRPGQPVRREFEYIRHGTLTLMGAFDVRAGKLFGFVSEDHDALTFVDLLDVIDTCYPEGKGHIICDNLSAHDTDDVLDWFDDHPRWQRHFTPKHASWLNQIEDAFSILAKHVLARGSFTSLDDLRRKIYDYLVWFNETGHIFNWTYQPKSWSENYGTTSDARH
jgi:hypothetical protein